MSDPAKDIFLTDEQEAEIFGADASDVFLSDEAEVEAGLREPPPPEPELPEQPQGFQPTEGRKAPGSDFFAGMGNTLNAPAGLIRAMNAMGVIDDQMARDTLAELEADHETRRDRGLGFAGGELLGNVAVSAATGAGAARAGLGAADAALATGALEGAVSEGNRTGRLGDAATGAMVGALGGAAGHAGGKLIGRGASNLRGMTRQGELEAQLAENAARRAAKMKRLGGVAQKNAAGEPMPLPDPTIPAGSYDEGLDALPDALARLAVKGEGAVRSAVEKGRIGPQGMADALEVLGREAREATAPTPISGLGGLAKEGFARGGAPVAEALASRTRAPFTGAAVSFSGAYGRDSGEAAGQVPSYVDIAEQEITPRDDLTDENFEALREAYGSEALQAYPGLANELSGMLGKWVMGEEPDPSAVALMTYKLSEVPGLDWASIDPTRTFEE